MSGSYDLPKDFFESLASKYEAAISNEDVVFSGKDAVEELVHEQSIDFNVTLLKSLENRPVNGTKKLDPFANPEPELTILPEYGRDNELKLVFNKFPVVPHHFLMVTKDFVSQNTPLNSSELMSISTILKNLESNNDKEWFAFYNCGTGSGASQPHKHIQFMTLPKGFVPYAQKIALQSEPFLPNDNCEPLQDGSLPFAHFVARLPDSDFNEDDLSTYFATLIQRTLTVLRENDAEHISYNFIMTTKYMLMVPRSRSDYKELGFNSCGALGLILCKNNDLLQLVKEDGPLKILESVTFPSTAGQKSDEYSY